MERRRSFWGWGWEDRFPDAAARRKLGARVAAVLGATLEPREPPALAAVRLPEPRLPIPEPLRPFADAGREARVTHTYGKGYRDLVRGFAGDFSPAPDLVATPRTEAEVVTTLATCVAAGLAVIPFGGGTSVVSGTEADVGPGFTGVVSLDLRALDRVLEVDVLSRAARIQAGILGPSLEAQLAPHGLTLRHFPQSFEFSTLGGWIATRSAGHFATLTTHIDSLVESLRVVTPAGPWETRRFPASGAGPSADRLMCGSEGILGVITEAWVKLHARPAFRASASVHFDAFEEALAAAREIVQAGLWPTNCRVLDAGEALLHQVARDGSSVLLVGFESADHPVAAPLARALELAAARNGRCPAGPILRADDEHGATPDAAGSWRTAFFEAPYLQSALVSLGVLVDTFETACTWDRFPAMHAEVTARVQEALGRVAGGGLVTCRLTHLYPDGAAPYFTFLGLAKPGEELAQWAAVKEAASEALLASGATITHHHAVGRLHRPFHERERPPLFGDVLGAAKATLDPSGILNPGVLLRPRRR